VVLDDARNVLLGPLARRCHGASRSTLQTSVSRR
jgi:hypothetical protein